MKKKFLCLIFIVTLIHFLKDITQDILQIPTIFDYFGNIQEDLTRLPPLFTGFITVLGYLSFVGEIVILTFIPKIFKNNFKNKTYNRIVYATITILVLYFLTVSILDPNIFCK